MKDVIPFFYYDLIAKIGPGTLLLALISKLGARAPVWSWIFEGSEGWKSALVPVLIGGTTYFLGSILEVLFRMLCLYDKISERGFEKAAKDFNDETDCIPELKLTGDKIVDDKNRRKFRYTQWQRLVFQGESNAAAFSQAHRFQAEGKFFLHSSVPIAGLALVITCTSLRSFHFISSSLVAIAVASVLVAVLFLFAWNSEYRRWVQVLAFVRNARSMAPQLEGDKAKAAAVPEGK